MSQLINDRWFPLVDLSFAFISGVLWFMAAGELSWQPLVVGMLPWALRLAAGERPFRRTPFDGLVALFLVTAVIGVWAAYDRSAAMSKFWIMVSAILIYYALAGQSRRDIWLAAGILGSGGAAVAIYFLLTHDWGAWAADIGLLTQIGTRWMEIRPSLPGPSLHPNRAAGMIAVLFPFLLAFGLYGQRKKQRAFVWYTAVMAVIALTGLLFTSSRAAWVAVTASLSVWLLWGLSERVSGFFPLSRKAAFGGMLAILLVLAVSATFFLAGGPLAVIGRLPGADSTTGRLDLMRHTLWLVGDFPITGGGLAAFAGLYSTYVMVTPFYLFDYSHNFLLDVMLEQGVVGALALFVLLLGVGWRLVRAAMRSRRRRSKRQMATLRWAILAGLLTMLLHGLIDDALYGGLGSPLLLALPGVAVVATRKSKRSTVGAVRKTKRLQRPAILGLGVLAFFLGMALSWQELVAAPWYANRGAVQMARAELTQWPTNEWNDGRYISDLGAADELLQKALKFDADNRTAAHRLGLIAMQKQEFETAVQYLEAAHAADGDHRGIVKALAYAYVWTGNLDTAATLLDRIPEAKMEMNNYVRWWAAHGRQDLAARADTMAGKLMPVDA